MSRRFVASAGAFLMFLALAFTPGSAFAASRPHRVAGPATDRLHIDAKAVLVPGTGYGLYTGSVQVRVLQRKLDRAGFASGPVDGRYGPLTMEAVRRFQRVHGLVVDGLAGPRTFAAFRTVLLVPGTGYGLRRGSVQVRALQRKLDRAGFASGPVDGLYGPRTTEAVRRLQRAGGLTMDGVAGPRTFAVLRAYLSRRTGVRPIGARHNPVHPKPTPLHRIVPVVPTRVELPVLGQSPAVPNLDMTPVLFALLILGLLTATLSYRTARQRIRVSAGMASRRSSSPRSFPPPGRFGRLRGDGR